MDHSIKKASLFIDKVYDMCKAADRGMVMTDVALVEKVGGRSGHWQR